MNRVTCTPGGCGKTFGMPYDEYEWYKLSGESWKCPYCGHGYSFAGGSLKRVRSKLESLKRYESAYYEKSEKLEKEINRNRGLRSYITRLKRREQK